MRGLRILPFVLGLFLFLYPIGAEKSTNYSCDTCHRHPSLYSTHLEGGKYCSKCHGEIHEIHNLGCEACHVKKPLTILCHAAPADAQIPTAPPGKIAVCENCHVNIVETHNGDCQICHTEDVNKIHAKANWR